jgi:hypothetical protein
MIGHNRAVKTLEGIADRVPVFIRWIAALAWTALVCALMLLPGNDGGVVDDTSTFFGNRDLTDAIGHVALFFALAALWQWALRDRRRAIGLAAALGILTEGAQSLVPDRGASLLDLGANVLGVILFYFSARQ